MTVMRLGQRDPGKMTILVSITFTGQKENRSKLRCEGNVIGQ